MFLAGRLDRNSRNSLVGQITSKNCLFWKGFVPAARGKCAALDSPDRGEADRPLEDIDVRGLDRGESVNPRDLLHEAHQFAPFFGGEPFVEEIGEQFRRLFKILRTACNEACMSEALVQLAVESRTPRASFLLWWRFARPSDRGREVSTTSGPLRRRADRR